MYRRKMQRCGLTFSELLQSILGFTNKGSVDALQTSLALSNSASLMRGLHRLGTASLSTPSLPRPPPSSSHLGDFIWMNEGMMRGGALNTHCY